MTSYRACKSVTVSTHSRLKAAGYLLPFRLPISFCFNTQPPKGGWGNLFVINPQKFVVSTHSRLKAAGSKRMVFCWPPKVSTHSRLKAAGDSIQRIGINSHGFNTQPPKGG